MRLGLTSPVVTLLPGVHSEWESTAGIEDLATIAEAADRLGFDHLTCSEHVAVPTEVAANRGGTYWDPLATLGFLAARTRRIRLATQVLVLGYHHPLEIAKRYGTLDTVSGGRLVLGLGVGSLEEEFDLLGATFAGRGAIADEALLALRAGLASTTPEHHGEHFDFSDLVVAPNAVQDAVPFWIGGRTPRSLRRAVELGTGWVPFGLGADALAEMLAKVDLPEDFEVVLGPGRPVDPTGDRDRCLRALTRLTEAGATVVNVNVQATSAAHYVEQLEALAELGGLTA
ncbi:MAG: LLM class F420-dependent oxidoreductase [Nocardioides sp.]|uniref:LLM class F420-dependent oxidoreductase n=1 Tax=Nocardioides sp. TaxID=35761 RepID=UPI003F0133C5